jgi:hypothetical protein
MFDDPPADLEDRDDLYRVDVLRYGQTGFLDEIPDLSDERRNSLFRSFSVLACPMYFLLYLFPFTARQLRHHWGLAPGLSQ